MDGIKWVSHSHSTLYPARYMSASADEEEERGIAVDRGGIGDAAKFIEGDVFLSQQILFERREGRKDSQ